MERNVKANKKSTKTKVLKLAFLAIVFIGAYTALGEKWVDIWIQIRSTSKYIIVGICMLSVLYNLLEGKTLKLILRRYDQKLKYKTTIAVAYYSAFFRLATLGTGTAAAGMYYVNQRGIPVSKSLGSFTLNYALDRVSTSLFFVILYISNYNMFNALYVEYKKYIALGIVVAFIVVVFLIMFCTSELLQSALFKLASLLDFRKHFEEEIAKAQDQAKQVRKETKYLLESKGLLVKALFFHMLKLSSWYAIPTVLFGVFGTAQMWEFMAIAGLWKLIVGVVPVPGGVGSSELLFAVLFTPVVGSIRAVSGALLYRFATYIFPFIIGSIVLLKNQRKIKNSLA